MKPVRAVYPGTFDPFTLGHRDILERAAGLFSHVTVAVAESTLKKTLFSAQERAALAEGEIKGISNADVRIFRGLLRDFVLQEGYGAIVRGIRGVSDFSYEVQMAGVNRMLVPEAETLFLMTQPSFEFVTSSSVREIGSLGGSLEGFVSESVARAVRAKFGRGESSVCCEQR
ncbi:pantetheine-phosphate adenylyltransferase [Mesosutterella sp. AGMB02718]|uniref:Phosphopantetheine adenylyltransferase n=1 Tax=Mesosutterella faecium TaxID=2925194 RepID=A0ABT7IKM3_9BURK|nr:pantetheine-phosphate adenylyltransferase [Mesosutterella sp. AGMB02718]MDL2058914.1 pantetheine-phosphate adenylyltransferase [Mesosutterella sp. AGMB02718]